MKIAFSIIIPVYNRPEEIDELLASILSQEYDEAFDVCIIEDGSSVKSDLIVDKYSSQLSIHYLEKQNTGPGASRNYGMSKGHRKLLYYPRLRCDPSQTLFSYSR